MKNYNLVLHSSSHLHPVKAGFANAQNVSCDFTTNTQTNFETSKQKHMNLPINVPLQIPNQLLRAKKFEIWSGGKKIESGITETDLWVEQEYPEQLIDGIKMTVRVFDNSRSLIYKYIKERFYFDVAYATNDRILVGIIPQTSNVLNSKSYDGFIYFAQFTTRKEYHFDNDMPFCCSLFFDETNELIKVTYSNGINKTLIEFTI